MEEKPTEEKPTQKPPTNDANFLERFVTSTDGVRNWVGKAWRLGYMMVKGAYIVAERRRLLGRLGKDVYEKISEGEIQNDDLEPTVHQLDRLTKKIEIEEKLINSLRFGKKHKPRHTLKVQQHPNEEPNEFKAESPSKKDTKKDTDV